MAMPSLPSLDAYGEPTSLSVRWQKWLKQFKSAMTAFDITSDTRLRASLLHFGGDDIQDIFETLPDTGDDTDYSKAVEALSKYFTPKKNIYYETLLFHATRQEQKETIQDFATRLRRLATKCDFHDADREIYTQLIKGSTNQTFVRHAMQKERTLAKLLEAAQSMDATVNRFRDLDLEVGESRHQQVHKISTHFNSNPNERISRDAHVKYADRRDTKRECYLCGGEYPHSNRCPAEGRECSYCGKLNHFAEVCRSRSKHTRESSHSQSMQTGAKPKTYTDSQPIDTHTGAYPKESTHTGGRQAVRAVKSLHEQYHSDEDSYDETVHVYCLDHVDSVNKIDNDASMTTVLVNDIPLRVCIDSGCKLNIIDETSYNSVQQKTKQQIHLHNTTIKLIPYLGTEPLPMMGVFKASIQANSELTHADVYVVKGTAKCLLGHVTSTTLQLLQINPTHAQVHKLNSTQLISTQQNSTNSTQLNSTKLNQLNPTQLNSTQLNSTKLNQLNSTQLNSTQLNKTQPTQLNSTQLTRTSRYTASSYKHYAQNKGHIQELLEHPHHSSTNIA